MHSKPCIINNLQGVCLRPPSDCELTQDSDRKNAHNLGNATVPRLPGSNVIPSPALHWPNPVLVPLTFIGGAAMARMFARVRNLLPLAAGQALLGLLMSCAFPIAWHHMMRVGPGYYLPYMH